MVLAGETELTFIQFSSSLEENLGAPVSLSCWIFPSQTQNLEGNGECRENL